MYNEMNFLFMVEATCPCLADECALENYEYFVCHVLVLCCTYAYHMHKWNRPENKILRFYRIVVLMYGSFSWPIGEMLLQCGGSR